MKIVHREIHNHADGYLEFTPWPPFTPQTIFLLFQPALHGESWHPHAVDKLHMTGFHIHFMASELYP